MYHRPLAELGQATDSMNILVVGGAGYIGSHVVRLLRTAGMAVTVYDDLSTGNAWAVPEGTLVRGSLADIPAVEALFAGRHFDAALHFAARIVVSESVADPLAYYASNTRNTIALLEQCALHGVRHVVFSSTAAVYGEGTPSPIPEDAPLRPSNPYGASKMMSERVLMDTAEAGGPGVVALRYFNAAGAAEDGTLGEAHEPETHLIPLALEVASGRRQHLNLYGTDFPTRDGTCIRDYVHVEDLAQAHLDALRYLTNGGESVALNCGYGRGYSVREVIETVRKVTGHPLPVRECRRRPGDPPELVAESRRIREKLGWAPRKNDLTQIVFDAWLWEQKRPR